MNSKLQMAEAALKKALGAAKHRAKAKNLPFALDMDWALGKIEQQQFRCCMSGIEFFATNSAKSIRRPFVPSLDRIDCREGYTKENTRIVILAINIMLMDWGVEVFEQVVNSYIAAKLPQTKKDRNGPDEAVSFRFPLGTPAGVSLRKLPVGRSLRGDHLAALDRDQR